MDESGNGKLIELQDLGKANKTLIVSHSLVCNPLFFHSIPFHGRVPFPGLHPGVVPADVHLVRL